MELELETMNRYLNCWYSAKDYFRFVKISFFSEYKGELMVFLSDGRGVSYKEFGKEFEPATNEQLDKIWKGFV